MRSSLLFALCYQFLFAVLSLSLTAMFEGYGGEIFAGIFWFNVIYGVVGIITNSSSIYFGEDIFKDNFLALMIFQSIVIVVIVNLLFYFLDKSFVSISLFTCVGDQFTLSLMTHAFILVALSGAGLLYRRVKQKPI